MPTHVCHENKMCSNVNCGFVLCAIAVLPFVVQGVTNLKTLTIGGTGILIVVSVVIEIMKQIESQMIMRDYEGF